MRNIKRITHLRYERKKLHRREEELEKIIRNDWKVICQTLQPTTLAREALSSCAAWIGRKMLSKATQKN